MAGKGSVCVSVFTVQGCVLLDLFIIFLAKCVIEHTIVDVRALQWMRWEVIGFGSTESPVEQQRTRGERGWGFGGG